MIKKPLLMLTLSASVLAGCQTTSGYKTNKSSSMSVYPEQLNSLEIISQKSQQAAEATNMLVKYQQQFNETLDYRQRSFENDEIRINYIGKPDDLLASIAYRYGYRYIELGSYRDLPTVNFTDYWTTPKNAVLNTDAQLKNTANIAVDAQNKTITLIYK